MTHWKKTSDTVDCCGKQHGDRAVVIGSSITGLLVARVLVNHFEHITVVERDCFPAQPSFRPGVPQSHQLHVLLAQGQRIMEQLFPGLEDELAARGAEAIDWGADFRWLLLGGWALRFSSEIVTHACSRNLLEAVIRQHLTNYSQVEFLEATKVTGLLANAGKTTVTGVEIGDRNGKQAQLPAQLVVDASGRHSLAPKWLQRLGYEMPQETVINSFLGYASRSYQFLSGKPLDCKVLYIFPKAPNHPRGGGIYHVEGNRWIVTLVGIGRDYPPTDELGFLEFARSLRSLEIYQAIKDAQAVSPIYGYQRTENRLRHYERLSRLPENFVVVGDAACAFNPVYGQGMSVAALGALTLDRCLIEQKQRCSGEQELAGLAQRFQSQLAQVNTGPWLIATGDDFRWSTTIGGRPDRMTRLMHWYLDQVMLSASQNAQVYKVFLEVLHLLSPARAFFQPQILAQVLLRLMKFGS